MNHTVARPIGLWRTACHWRPSAPAKRGTPTCCVTVISADACRQVAPAADTVSNAAAAPQSDPRPATYMVTASHSAHCGECDHLGGAF